MQDAEQALEIRIRVFGEEHEEVPKTVSAPL